MITKTIIYTDSNGKAHKCETIGRSVFVSMRNAPTLEERITRSIRAASHDSSVGPDAEILNLRYSNMDIRIVITTLTYYFVRIHANNILEVKVDEYSNFGFTYTPDRYKIIIQHENDITILWFVDRHENVRISHYFALQW